MDTSSKVLVLPNICGIELVSSAAISTSKTPSLQPFYNTIVQNGVAQPAYVTISKVSYSERGKSTRAGVSFEQKLQLQFPSNDPLRVQRIHDFLKAKYIYIRTSTGMVFFFGRNDGIQNAAPKIDITSTEKHTQITYTIESMAPIGFTNGSFEFQLAEGFPVNFYNL